MASRRRTTKPRLSNKRSAARSVASGAPSKEENPSCASTMTTSRGASAGSFVGSATGDWGFSETTQADSLTLRHTLLDVEPAEATVGVVSPDGHHNPGALHPPLRSSFDAEYAMRELPSTLYLCPRCIAGRLMELPLGGTDPEAPQTFHWCFRCGYRGEGIMYRMESAK